MGRNTREDLRFLSLIASKHVSELGKCFENTDGEELKPEAYISIRRGFRIEPDTVVGTFNYSETCFSEKPSSSQPVTPPIIFFTGRPSFANRIAAFSVPLQCGPAQ